MNFNIAGNAENVAVSEQGNATVTVQTLQKEKEVEEKITQIGNEEQEEQLRNLVTELKTEIANKDKSKTLNLLVAVKDIAPDIASFIVKAWTNPLEAIGVVVDNLIEKE